MGEKNDFRDRRGTTVTFLKINIHVDYKKMMQHLESAVEQSFQNFHPVRGIFVESLSSKGNRLSLKLKLEKKEKFQANDTSDKMNYNRNQNRNQNIN